MGGSHARGYAALPGYQIGGFVVAKNVERAKKLAKELKVEAPVYTDYYQAMKEVKPEVVSINTYVDTHAAFSTHAMRQGCHVFMEKPIAKTVKPRPRRSSRSSWQTKRKLVIGYILRVHPAWTKFIELTRTLGKPLIMRMNLNQQSFGKEWALHKTFIANMPPLVDCGVHYVDVMCQMTRAKPRLVQGIAARVSDEVDADKHNYGMLQVVFDDDSVGWYEVGWGPMMSSSRLFRQGRDRPQGLREHRQGHHQCGPLGRLQARGGGQHHPALQPRRAQTATRPRRTRSSRSRTTPDHNELCKREQEVLYKAITENVDLTDHVADAVNSLKICFAAVESYRTGKTIHLT